MLKSLCRPPLDRATATQALLPCASKLCVHARVNVLAHTKEILSKDMEEEEVELKAFLEDHSLGHLFENMTIKLGITSIQALKGECVVCVRVS